MRPIFLLVAILVLAPAVAASPDGWLRAREPYYGPGPEALLLADLDRELTCEGMILELVLTPEVYPGGCYVVAAQEIFEVRIRDATGLPVAGAAMWVGYDFEPGDAFTFCGTHSDAPRGLALRVIPLDSIRSAQLCGATTTGATTGYLEMWY